MKTIAEIAKEIGHPKQNVYRFAKKCIEKGTLPKIAEGQSFLIDEAGEKMIKEAFANKKAPVSKSDSEQKSAKTSSVEIEHQAPRGSVQTSNGQELTQTPDRIISDNATIPLTEKDSAIKETLSHGNSSMDELFNQSISETKNAFDEFVANLKRTKE